MGARYRTAIFIDQSERSFPRDHLVHDGAFLGVITAHSKFGARTVGIVERQLAACAPTFTRPDEVRNALLSASAKIADANRDPTNDAGTASAVLAWGKLDGRIEIAQCGGGHVFHASDGVIAPVTTARSIARLAREAGTTLPDTAHAHFLTTMLGVPDPLVDLASVPWKVGDRIVIVSAGADVSSEDLDELLKSIEDDVPTLAGRIGVRIPAAARTRGVTVIVRELSGID